MPDDLLDRLPALAPDVDDAGAHRALDHVRAASRDRRRTRRVVTGAIAAALVAVATVVIVRLDHADRPVITTGPPPPKAFATTVVVGQLEATLTLPTGRVVLGGDAPVEVRVRNLSSTAQTLYEFGHCGGPLVSDPSTPPTYPTWDGTSPLVDLLRDPAVAASPVAVNGHGVGLANPGCDLSLTTDAVPPGDTRTWAGVLDGRVGPEARGDVVVRVSLGVGVDPRLGGRGDPLTVTSDPIPLPTVDAPGRTASAEHALEILATSPYVRRFVDDTRHAANLPAGMVRQWHPTIGWWEGAWELRLTPGIFGPEVLRVRYDPTVGHVVDARVVRGCPDDAPGCPEPSDLPDDVLSAEAPSR
jgi:hypothetical protein